MMAPMLLFCTLCTLHTYFDREMQVANTGFNLSLLILESLPILILSLRIILLITLNVKGHIPQSIP